MNDGFLQELGNTVCCVSYRAKRGRKGNVDRFITSIQTSATVWLTAVTAAATATAMATMTAREKGEKYNLLHEGFPKLGAPHTVVLVCFAQGVG